MKLARQIFSLILIVALFGAFNLAMHMLLTMRLSNNFSGATQAQQIDVRRFLPHNDASDLPDVDASIRFTENFPVLDGAAALVPVYASVIDTLYPAESVTFIGGEFDDDNYHGENFAPDSAMQYKNTVRGYKAIVDGSTDILFCAAPSEEQRRYAEENGVELVYVPIGLEGFVFFVNENNPVDSLTTEQIRQIYAGDVTNWREIGGANRVINPVTRLEGSGSQTAFENFMGDREIARKSPLAITGGSIGFSFRYYLDGLVGNESVKMLALNGVYPSAEAIRSREYPIVAQFYAIYRADNDNPNVPILVDWLLSDEGQSLIEESGYVRIKRK